MQNANGTSTAFRDLHGPQRYRNAVPIFVQTTISAFSAVSASSSRSPLKLTRIETTGTAMSCALNVRELQMPQTNDQGEPHIPTAPAPTIRHRPPRGPRRARRTGARKTAARKSVARKTATRRTAARKTAARKTAARKTAVRKRVTRRTVTRKTEARKTASRKTAPRRTAARKTAARKTASRNTAPRRTAARKTAVRKTAARKTATRRTPARKTAARKFPVSRRRRTREIDASLSPRVETPLDETRTEEAPARGIPPEQT